MLRLLATKLLQQPFPGSNSRHLVQKDVPSFMPTLHLQLRRSTATDQMNRKAALTANVNNLMRTLIGESSTSSSSSSPPSSSKQEKDNKRQVKDDDSTLQLDEKDIQSIANFQDSSTVHPNDKAYMKQFFQKYQDALLQGFRARYDMNEQENKHDAEGSKQLSNERMDYIASLDLLKSRYDEVTSLCHKEIEVYQLLFGVNPPYPGALFDVPKEVIEARCNYFTPDSTLKGKIAEKPVKSFTHFLEVTKDRPEQLAFYTQRGNFHEKMEEIEAVKKYLREAFPFSDAAFSNAVELKIGCLPNLVKTVHNMRRTLEKARSSGDFSKVLASSELLFPVSFSPQRLSAISKEFLGRNTFVQSWLNEKVPLSKYGLIFDETAVSSSSSSSSSSPPTPLNEDAQEATRAMVMVALYEKIKTDANDSDLSDASITKQVLDTMNAPPIICEVYPILHALSFGSDPEQLEKLFLAPFSIWHSLPLEKSEILRKFTSLSELISTDDYLFTNNDELSRLLLPLPEKRSTMYDVLKHVAKSINELIPEAEAFSTLNEFGALSKEAMEVIVQEKLSDEVYRILPLYISARDTFLMARANNIPPAQCFDQFYRIRASIKGEMPVTLEEWKASIDQQRMMSKIDEVVAMIPHGVYIKRRAFNPVAYRWLQLVPMQERLGFEISKSEHRILSKSLDELVAMPGSYLARELLQSYHRVDADLASQKRRPQLLDSKNCAHAIGRRKASSAFIKLYRDTSCTYTINGRPLYESFVKVKDRRALLEPLERFGLLGLFSFKAIVHGGGHTGRAEAIRLALSNALVTHAPQLRDSLKLFGYLTRDTRVVESKKAGRKKARRSFQWVKR